MRNNWEWGAGEFHTSHDCISGNSNRHQKISLKENNPNSLLKTNSVSYINNNSSLYKYVWRPVEATCHQPKCEEINQCSEPMWLSRCWQVYHYKFCIHLSGYCSRNDSEDFIHKQEPQERDVHVVYFLTWTQSVTPIEINLCYFNSFNHPQRD